MSRCMCAILSTLFSLTLSSSTFAAVIAKFSSNSNPADPSRAHSVVCEIHEDKLIVTNLQGGIGGSIEKPFQFVGVDQFHKLSELVLSYKPKPFRSLRASSRETVLQIYPNGDSSGVSIYSVKDQLVTSYEYVIPPASGGSGIGPHFSSVYEKIGSICNIFGGVSIGETEWPGGGA